MRYLFLIGRNAELSLAELFSYFEKNAIGLLEYKLEKNILLVDINKDIDVDKTLKELGGVIAAGKVLFFGEISEIVKKLDKEVIYFGSENKFKFSLLNLTNEESDDYDLVLDKIKQNLKREKLKAMFKYIRRGVKMQNDEIAEGSPSEIYGLDEVYFLIKDKQFGFGFLKSYDTKEVSQRYEETL